MRPAIGAAWTPRLWWWLSLCVAALLAWPLPAQAKPVPVPPMQSRVVDLTKTLKPSEAEALRQQIASIENESQAQLAVLIVPTTGEDSIEQYATRVFAAWKLGREQEDDGMLLLVALKDRRMRIEVGTGLESSVTDIQAARIIDEQMTPAFRKGDFAGGIEAALQALSQRVGTQPSMMIAYSAYCSGASAWGSGTTGGPAGRSASARPLRLRIRSRTRIPTGSCRSACSQRLRWRQPARCANL
jgi:uncharacterized protein